MEFLQGISGFDIILGAVILLLGFKGILSGFIKEASGLFGIIGGVYVASRVDMKVGNYINDIIGILSTDSAISLVGFTITLGLFWSASYASGQVLSKVLALSGLGIADRLLGFLFSAGKMFMIFSMIFYVISNTRLGAKLEKKLSNSQLYPLFLDVGDEIVALDDTKIVKNIGKDVKEVLDKTKEKAKNSAKEKIKEETARLKESIDGNISKSVSKNISKDISKAISTQEASINKRDKELEKKIKAIKSDIESQEKKLKTSTKKVKSTQKKKVEKHKKIEKKVAKKIEKKKPQKQLKHTTKKPSKKSNKKKSKKVDDELKQIEADIQKLKSSSGQELDLSDDENEVIKF
jgi:membrane protein required for colicin V production